MPLTPELTEFTTSSPVIASFDINELASGVAIRNLYLARTRTSTGYDESLTVNQIYSGDVEFEGTATASATFVKTDDLDFDLTTFNKAITARGTAILNDGFAMAVTGGGGVGLAYIIAKVRKWDGTTETEIASAQSEEITGTDGVGIGTTILSLPIVIPKTPFKVGQTLRLTIEIWAKTTAGTNKAYLGTDPQNRDGSVLTTAIDMITRGTLYMPFDVNK